MKTSSKSEFEVKEGRTKIAVQHQGKRITFVAPRIGPGTYNQVGEQIDNAKLLRPTFAETVSLVYSAMQNRGKKYADEVLSTLNHYSFWGFNDILYVPKEGAFISDRNRKDIHVPFGFKTREQSFEDFASNPFVLALAEGEEGANKLVEIAESQKLKPYVLSFDKINSKEKNVVSLNSGGLYKGLLFLSSILVGGSGGFAFGVQK